MTAIMLGIDLRIILVGKEAIIPDIMDPIGNNNEGARVSETDIPAARVASLKVNWPKNCAFTILSLFLDLD